MQLQFYSFVLDLQYHKIIRAENLHIICLWPNRSCFRPSCEGLLAAMGRRGLRVTTVKEATVFLKKSLVDAAIESELESVH